MKMAIFGKCQKIEKIQNIDFLKIDFYHEFIFLTYLYRLKIVDLVGLKVLKNCFEHTRGDYRKGQILGYFGFFGIFGIFGIR